MAQMSKAETFSRLCSRSPLYFLFLSTVIQCVATGLTLLVVHAAQDTLESLNVAVFVLVGLVLYAALALALAFFLDLPPLWRLFNVLFLPAIVGMQELNLPNEVFPIAVCVALLLYLPTLWTRVPYYPSSRAMYEAVLKELPESKEIRFIDLGCGFAGLLCYLAKSRPDSQFVGVELSPLAYAVSKINALSRGAKNLKIQYRSIWGVPLSEFDVAYAFLAPPPMAALWEKASEELPAGGIFLVNSFPVPDVKAQEIKVPGSRQVTLYRYQK